MGVAGLWDILRPAGQVRSLTELAVVEGFEKNVNGLRGFRIGIDASIWFFHANWGKEGENPELRTLFFRCATLLHAPFLPLFVFDGPKRPDFKRGKRINTTAHKLTSGMKQIIEAFGFEWRTAPGEAEAELAYLNRTGIIDGILSDDVDTFLFGATMVIRNSSNTLSGNRANPVLNSDGRDDKNHSVTYRLDDITSDPNIALTRGGFILIGLLRGGDYHQEGLPRCGVIIAAALARCGFGDSLYEAARNLPRPELEEFLVDWRNEIRQELRTDSRGHLGKKYVSLSKSVPDAFPNIEVLLSYTNPITSETMGRSVESAANRLRWAQEPDLGKIAETCEFFFEWGYKEAIVKRFRTVIWPSIVLRILRRSVLNAETASASRDGPPSTPRKNRPDIPPSPFGTPSKMITKHFSTMKLSDEQDEEDGNDLNQNLVIKIHSSRRHASTDMLLEYRLEIAPAHLVRLTEGGVKGIRRPEDADEWSDDGDEDEDGAGRKTKKAPPDPESHLRVWMPASIVRMAEPQIVQEYQEAEQRKAEKKMNKGRKANTSSEPKGKGKGTKKVKEPVGEDIPPKTRVSTKANAKSKAEAGGTSLKSFYAVEKKGATKLSSLYSKPNLDGEKLSGSKAATSRLNDHARRFSVSSLEADSDLDVDLPARIHRPELTKKRSPPPYVSVSDPESDGGDNLESYHVKPPKSSKQATSRSKQKASTSTALSSPAGLTAKAFPLAGFPSLRDTTNQSKRSSTPPPRNDASSNQIASTSCHLHPIITSNMPAGEASSSDSAFPSSSSSSMRRKKSTLSGSDSDARSCVPLQKSPRKSAKHRSPRGHETTPCRSGTGRPVSPSPARAASSPMKIVGPSARRLQASVSASLDDNDPDVIVISSEEEEDLPPPPPKLDLQKKAPLLMARMRAAERSGQSRPLKKPAAKPSIMDLERNKLLTAKDPLDIIDLT